MSKDYYKILGVDKKASGDDVKKAFRKLAQKYHPDKSGGDESKFKEVNEAYQILSDEKRRAEYDTYGRTFEQGGGPGFSAGGGPASGWDFSNFANMGFAGGGEDVEFDIGDIFGDFFSGGRAKRARGRDISIDLELSFAESVFGTERKILLSKNITCTTCSGTGAKKDTEMVKCSSCGGKGQIRDVHKSIFGSISTSRECAQCHGRGEIPKEPCIDCRGGGIKHASEEIRVRTPSGISDGEMIRMTGKGEAVRGGPAGDLYIKVHVQKHSLFRREGANLIMELPIKLSDALLGTEYNIETLDGQAKINIPEYINHGEIIRLKGKGVPLGDSRRGDLLVQVKVTLPNRLSRKAKNSN